MFPCLTGSISFKFFRYFQCRVAIFKNISDMGIKLKMFINSNSKEFVMLSYFYCLIVTAYFHCHYYKIDCAVTFCVLKITLISSFYNCFKSFSSFSNSMEHFVTSFASQLLQIVESSAYWMHWPSDKIFVISATHILKRMGESRDPWGTRKSIIKILEMLESICTKCLSAK